MVFGCSKIVRKIVWMPVETFHAILAINMSKISDRTLYVSGLRPLPCHPTVIIFQKYTDISFFSPQWFAGFGASPPPPDDHTVIILKSVDPPPPTPRPPRAISFGNVSRTPVNQENPSRKCAWKWKGKMKKIVVSINLAWEILPLLLWTFHWT